VIRIDPSDPAPIWSQIEEAMRRLVATGALKAGVAVPSVRDLARDLRINPATVARAYQRLTDAGVLMVKRGDGTYVADSPPSMSRAERARILREAATRYTSFAWTLGATREEGAEAFEAAWQKRGARS
jgi:GntR family transcriptional regulator